MASTLTLHRATNRDDELHARRDRVRFLTIPKHRFVMVDGCGPPASNAFEARIPSLYTFAYGLRFELKGRGVISKVGPLEGLWWTTDGSADLDDIFRRDGGARKTWRWSLLIVVPDVAWDPEIAKYLEEARVRLEPSIATSLRVESFDEGDAAQIMHIGPYEREQPTIERLHQSIHEAGFQPTGRHHELYLGDPRRAAPDRLRTLLRMPITR